MHALSAAARGSLGAGSPALTAVPGILREIDLASIARLPVTIGIPTLTGQFAGAESVDAAGLYIRGRRGAFVPALTAVAHISLEINTPEPAHFVCGPIHIRTPMAFINPALFISLTDNLVQCLLDGSDLALIGTDNRYAIL